MDDLPQHGIADRQAIQDELASHLAALERLSKDKDTALALLVRDAIEAALAALKCLAQLV